MAISYLTTVDNPFNPKTEFKRWHSFDMQKGYFTTEFLNRVFQKNSDLYKERNNLKELNEEEEKAIYEDSIEEIIEFSNKISNFSAQKEKNDGENSEISVKYRKIVE